MLNGKSHELLLKSRLLGVGRVTACLIPVPLLPAFRGWEGGREGRRQTGINRYFWFVIKAVLSYSEGAEGSADLLRGSWTLLGKLYLG